MSNLDKCQWDHHSLAFLTHKSYYCRHHHHHHIWQWCTLWDWMWMQHLQCRTCVRDIADQINNAHTSSRWTISQRTTYFRCIQRRVRNTMSSFFPLPGNAVDIVSQHANVDCWLFHCQRVRERGDVDEDEEQVSCGRSDKNHKCLFSNDGVECQFHPGSHQVSYHIFRTHHMDRNWIVDRCNPWIYTDSKMLLLQLLLLLL